MKKIDIYIYKKFLGTYFISTSIIISIAVVFDLSEKIDNFIDHKAPLELIVKDYYFNFIIHYSTVFSGLITFISVIFFTSRLSENSEIIALYNSKISPWRLIRPYIICAFVIFIPYSFLSNSLTPQTNEKRLEFENNFIKKTDVKSERNFNKSINNNSIIYMSYYNVNQKKGIDFCWQKLMKNKLQKKINSKIIKWDNEVLKWKITDYKIDSFIYNKNNDNFKIVSKYENGSIYINLKEDPNIIFKQKREIQSMTTKQISSYIKKERENGNYDLKLEIIEKTQRTTNLVSIIILTILGFSISIKKNKGGLGIKLTFGILLCFTYIFLMKFSSTLTLNGGVNPELAIWIPNFLFSMISLYSFKKFAF